jgi:hypothetical protein
MIDGIVELGGEQVFALQFLQARNPDWVRRPFYAKFDAQASWLDQLTPAFGERQFFFQKAADGAREPESIVRIARDDGRNRHETLETTN